MKPDSVALAAARMISRGLASRALRVVFH